MRWAWLAIVCAAALVGCAKSAVMPINGNTIQLTTGAAPVCGAVGAQKVAARQAAVETIRRGFDKFVILDGAYQNSVGVVGYTPVVAQTNGTAYATGYGNYAGQSTTTYSGGNPIIAGSHNQALVVKMFKDGDPAGANAVSARQQLGPDWKKAIEADATTCF